MTRFGYLSAVVVAVVAIAAATAAGTLASASGTQTRSPISASRAFIFPSANVCVSGHTLTFRLRQLPHVRWRKVSVFVNGRHFKTVKLSRIPRPVTLRGLPSGRFVLRATAYTGDGRRVTASRTYNACGSKPTTHALTVSLVGSGSGTVTGSGISCPGTCSHSYTAGTEVTLSASPASGSSFGGWSGGGCSGTGTCTVTMSSDEAVTATFTADHTLTVALAGTGSGSVAGSGIACPGTCSHSYTAGAMVTLTASPASGSSFGGWSGGGCSGTATCTVTMSSDQTVTATFTANGTSGPEPGSYSGSGYTLYVSTNRTQVQDVSLAAGYHAVLTCTPGGTTLNDTSFYIPQISIGADGSFSGTASQTGVEGGAAATFVYSISGRFNGTSVTGSLREDVTYNNGTAYSCTTGTTPWTMTRDTQGSQAAAPPPPGSYSGNGFTFYVSTDSTHVQDVSLAAGYHTAPACVPTGTISGDTSFYIPQISIGADGSFSGTASQTGVEGGAAATFTYTFSGHFHGTDSSGNERAAGSLREDVTYNNGTAHSCTTGTTPWTMTRNTQGSQAAAPPPPGSYSGNGFTFYVSTDSTHVQDVSLAAGYHTAPACVPTGTISNDTSFYIPQISIGADGSFSGTATQTGMANGAPATFTYTFSGHFHGTDSGGNEQAAGSLRENVTYNNGTSYSCTTGTTPWTMTRDVQGTQAPAPPPPGTYSGDGYMFHVSTDSSQVQNVSLASGYHTVLACAPGGATLNDTSFSIPQISIGADGSFSGTAMQAGTANGFPATFTYTFSGHFHGTNSSGNERAAGSLREDVTYTNGTAYSCTTGTTPWTMTRTGP